MKRPEKYPNLNLPPFEFKISKEKGKYFIFDRIRKKHLVLTPEEWVRQNFSRYLIDFLDYPAGLMQFEKELKYYDLKKRADILIHDNAGKEILMVECKAPEVKINQDVFDQIARYNHVLKLSYLIVTNGMLHYCCRLNQGDNKVEFLPEIPNYKEL